MASGCTLTVEPFEPLAADLGGVDNTSVPPGSLPTAGDDPPGTSTVETGSGEGVVIPGRGEPAGSNGGQLGGASEGTEGDVGVSDAGVTLPNGEAPDAGAVSPPSESCTSRAFGTSCYEIFGELAAWDVAEQRCVAWGGHLASVGSPEEEGFLEVWPSALGIVGADGSGIWLGGTDAARDGDFRWWDDSVMVFDNWAPNQPDNGAGVDCIAKRNDGTGAWYDQRCTDAHPYVCERPL